MARPRYDITDLVARIATAFERSDSDEAQMKAAAEAARNLLRDPAFLSEHYGLSKDGKHGDYLLYKHPQHEFVLRARVMAPGRYTPAHDHGELWAVYGVCEGQVQMDRYQRADDGSQPDYAELRQTKRIVAHAGELDTIAPWGIHDVAIRTAEPAVSLVIYSRPLNSVARNRYDPQQRTVRFFQDGKTPEEAHPEWDLTDRYPGARAAAAPRPVAGQRRRNSPG